MAKCKHCEQTGHPRTLYGMAIGYFCLTCFVTLSERAKKTVQKQASAMRQSVDNALIGVGSGQ